MRGLYWYLTQRPDAAQSSAYSSYSSSSYSISSDGSAAQNETAQATEEQPAASEDGALRIRIAGEEVLCLRLPGLADDADLPEVAGEQTAGHAGGGSALLAETIDEKQFNVFQRKQRNLSAVEIQRWTRGKLVRLRVRRQELAQFASAAVAVQAAARGWLTRRGASGAAVQALTAAATSGVMVDSPAKLPVEMQETDTVDMPESERPVWVKIIDRATREPYYWNRLTHETQWEPPLIPEEVSERDRRIEEKTAYCKHRAILARSLLWFDV